MQSADRNVRGLIMAVEDDGVILGPKAVDQIAKTVREVSRRMMNQPAQRGRWNQGQVRRSAVIGTTLAAPTSSLAVAEECTVYFLELQEDGTQILNVDPVTAYNDDPDVSASIGTYCRVEVHNGRWMIYYLGCSAQSALIDEVPT
jgi:hypothetical protein